jgi:acyl carrier protein
MVMGFDVEGLLRQHLPNLAPGEALRPEDTLVQLGIDSMRLVELIVSIEAALGVTMPDDELLAENFDTVRSLRSLVDRVAASAQA